MSEGAALLTRALAVLLLLTAAAGAVAVLVWARRPLWWVSWRVAVLCLALVGVWFAPKRTVRWARAALSAVRPHQGGRWGDPRADNGQRTTPVKVKLKALSAQRIATGRYGEPDWLAYGLLARGAITLLAADPKAGKTELLFALIRYAFAGLDFCGLKLKPMRVLVLSEQGAASLSPFLRRWRLFTEPTGETRAARWLHAQRLECLPRTGEPGHVVKVVSWAELYQGKTGDQRPTWEDIAPAGIALARRWKADVLVIDTLGRWAAGEDGSLTSGGSMLRAIGYLHEAAEAGMAVLINHHNSRSGNVYGAIQIEGECDVILKLSRAPAEGEKAALTTRRLLEGTGRYQETPAELLVRLVRRDAPAAGEPDAYYEVVAPAGRPLPPPVAAPKAAPPKPKEKTPPPQQLAVQAALTVRGLTGATVAALCEDTSLDRRRVDDALKALCARSLAFQRGTVPVPGGGPPAARYVATAALLTMKVEQEDAPPTIEGARGEVA